MENNLQIIECPRDAMQGWHSFIDTDKKIEYINQLLKVGFHTLDFGSFVSPKAIPQMADTKQVLASLNLKNTNTQLLAIVANLRGAIEALEHQQIDYLGFPFSISPTFQMRNTNSTIEDSLQTVKQMQQLCLAANKQLVVYLSMAFGNPYGDEYNEQVLMEYAKQIADLGVNIISLADTVGLANPEQISNALNVLQLKNNHITYGVHLHTAPHNWYAKIDAAISSNCKRIDVAINGIGGCPMANDDLVGNFDTLKLLQYINEKELPHQLNKMELAKAISIANRIFV
jgi:hydroxymethylglutaryl-CoA lyase